MFKVLAIVIIAGGAWLFWNKDNRSAEAPIVSSMLVPENTAAEKMIVETQSSETQEMSLAMYNWYFEPETINVKEGTKVKVHLTSVSGTHALAIPEFSVESKALTAGATETVGFTADKKGTFPFKCAVFCGEGHNGMKGTLIVE